MNDSPEKNNNVTIATIAERAGVSSATVSYVINDRKDVKIAEATRNRILQICDELNYKKGAKRERSEKKQVTIDDIAREAGVSTATVSYVVNDRKDVKISEATRRKVLQICNLRQFIPSPVARSLAGRKNNLIGICAERSDFFSKNAELFDLVCQLRRALNEQGYGALLVSPDQIGTSHLETVDGMLCVDLSEEQFYTLKESLFVPIVAIDMSVDDPLFFKAYTDFRAVAAAARSRLPAPLHCIAHAYRNEGYMNELKAAFPDLYVAKDIPALLSYVRARRGDRFLFLEETLAELCLPLIDAGSALVACRGASAPEAPALRLPAEVKAKHAVAMLQSAIARRESEPHSFLLTPQP